MREKKKEMHTCQLKHDTHLRNLESKLPSLGD
jgi:hypothetical protein